MKFKVGDRIAVYGMLWSHSESNYVNCIGTRLRITKIIDDNRITLEEDRSNIKYAAHPKQCRKLTKITKRRLWIHKNAFNSKYDSNKGTFNTDWAIYKQLPWDLRGNSFIELVEIKKKS